MNSVLKTWNEVPRVPAIAHMESGFQCAGCGEWNETTVDESAGREQKYVEDCQTCCKPNVLHSRYDEATAQYVIDAQLE